MLADVVAAISLPLHAIAAIHTVCRHEIRAIVDEDCLRFPRHAGRFYASHEYASSVVNFATPSLLPYATSAATVVRQRASNTMATYAT